MPSLNKALLMGHLTRDPELRRTPKGTAVCQFSLAINREWHTEAGDKQTEVTYVDVEAWGKSGETIAKYVTKGRPLYVEGRLRLDQWEDKTTKEKRSRLKVVLENFQFLGAPRPEPAEGPPDARAAATPAESAAASATPAASGPRPEPAEGPPTEDVPF